MMSTSTKELVIYIILLQAIIRPTTAGSYDSVSRLYTHIDDNNMASIPNDIPIQAEVVDLSRNAITTCQSFPDLPAVNKIVLKDNFLVEFPNLMAVRTNLTYVDLERNRITSISRELLSALTNLEVLLLSFNELASFPDVPMPKLYRLYLSGNAPMRNLPVLSVLGQTVEELTVGHPNMDDISATALKAMPKLVYLNLYHGGQTRVPPVIETNPLIEGLLLPHNAIRRLPEDFFLRLKRLRLIEVNDNLLTTFPDPCHVNYWMVTIRFGLNPISCDKRLFPLKIALISQIVYGNVICVSPADLTGRDLDSVSFEELRETFDEVGLEDCALWCRHTMDCDGWAYIYNTKGLNNGTCGIASWGKPSVSGVFNFDVFYLNK
ncbi:hypothetical protein LSH36_308g01014 [Paralvinella palmiformis]|uniref:Uncharacterized protein n=1 Tax=Paralvinella palmiformis TaxID=53620 RepID=A0AAD9JIY7_9ANNE|nr:hypothetical protein LSH36_308g01014 [Paralvinella palmiformis]